MKKPTNILNIAGKRGFSPLDLEYYDLLMFSNSEIRHISKRARKLARYMRDHPEF